MPIVEIDEVELLNLRKLHGIASRVMSHPQGKKLLEQAHKLVDPSAPTPAIDHETQIQAPAAEAMKQVAALKQQLADEKAERERDVRLAQLNSQVEDGKKKLRQGGWTEEGIKGVEKIMEDKGILDPLDAAAIFEKQHPPAAPATPSAGIGSWGFVEGVKDSEADLKRLIETRGENEGIVDKIARDALAEVRGPSRR